MSFRFILVAVALSVVPGFNALAQDAIPQPNVANSRYQIDGVINVDSVYVRSGPGEGYYPTQELSRGATVTVVGIKFDWLKILPPDGSFSYVNAAFVDHPGDSVIGKINRNNVNVRAGSLTNAMKTTVQTHLDAGAQVEIIGKEEEFLKIKPPAGAYLYVKKDFVTVAHPAVAANPDAANPPPAAPTAQNPPAAAPAIPGAQIDASNAILTSTPTTAPSAPVAAAPTTNPSAQAVAPSTQPAVAAAPPPPSPEELFAQYESKFSDISKKPLDSQPLDELIANYQSIAKSDQLSDELKSVVKIRIATLQARLDNKAKLVEVQRLEKLAAARQLALQAEQQELAERLKQSQIQVFVAVGTLQPSSLQVGGGTLYRLVDPATGRTEIYVRTSDSKITALMGQFIGINGEPTNDPQLSLRVIEPTDAQQIDESKVNSSIMAGIVPPSMLAREASSTN
jgi:SH3-like domain-containing protein